MQELWHLQKWCLLRSAHYLLLIDIYMKFLEDILNSSSPPVIFIAGRPKAALLLWFFGDFRCGALLFVVIHVIYKYKNR